MSWGITKKALNSTVGTPEFKPLDEIIKEWATKDYRLEEFVSMSYEPQLIAEPSNGYYGFSRIDFEVPLGNFSLVHGGTFTPASNMTSFSVEHFLGDDVTVAYVVANGSVKEESSYIIYNAAIRTPMKESGQNIEGVHIELYHDGRNLSYYIDTDSLPTNKFEFTTDNFTVRADTAYPFLAGVEYTWFVGVI